VFGRVTGQTPARLRYESLFFLGMAVVIVFLPLPNVFGILLDGTVLAIANPIIGNRPTLALLFVYNFNPIKLNGLISIYYAIYAVIYAVASRVFGIGNPWLVSGLAILVMVVLTLFEYLMVREVSVALWSLLRRRMPDL